MLSNSEIMPTTPRADIPPSHIFLILCKYSHVQTVNTEWQTSQHQVLDLQVIGLPQLGFKLPIFCKGSLCSTDVGIESVSLLQFMVI